MEYNTSALCDIYLEQVDVVEPIFNSYGGRTSFAGQITTIKCFEDSQLIFQALEEEGEGRVLLIDGGGSLRRALVDSDMAQLAVDNGWEGIIVYGSIREVDYIDELDIGVHAMASIPVGAELLGGGDVNIPVNFAGVSFLPNDYVYADTTGIILSADDLTAEDDDDEELEDEFLEEPNAAQEGE